MKNNQDKHQNLKNQCDAEKYTVAATAKKSTKLNI